jgi:hypothetical protein
MNTLEKLSERREWVSNLTSAQPSSWRVADSDVYLIGESGAVPSYTLKVGGAWVGWGHEGGEVIDHITGFQYARRKAIAEAAVRYVAAYVKATPHAS